MGCLPRFSQKFDECGFLWTQLFVRTHLEKWRVLDSSPNFLISTEKLGQTFVLCELKISIDEWVDQYMEQWGLWRLISLINWNISKNWSYVDNFKAVWRNSVAGALYIQRAQLWLQKYFVCARVELEFSVAWMLQAKPMTRLEAPTPTKNQICP